MPAAPFALAADEVDSFAFLGQRVRIMVDGERSADAFAAAVVEGPRGPASPLHIQPLEDETFFVLDGRITAHIDGREYAAETGGVVFIPRGTPHAYRIDTERATVLVVNTPAGHERFFKGLADQEPSPEELATAAAAAGFEILGPPPFAS